jgi:2-keto-4-pentenoate hydratase/2-oxohepta-3-ene-1,7-dioic acid hydratase in catechol pathway
MKLVTFMRDGSRRIGALETRDGRQVVIDLNRTDPRLPTDMIALLAGGRPALALAQDAVASAGGTESLELSALTLKAPIPRPGKIICIGLNYRDHAEESRLPIPDYPTVFSKYANSVTGPGEPIVIPRVSDQVDYEGELGVVIGRQARYVSEEEALGYVAGYMAFNDVSARNFQMRTSQWTIGKTFDTFAPMGPALVTADQVADPHHLDLRVTVSGQVLQDSNTRHLIFNVPQLVAYLSQAMTLEPGDVIATGTPGGVGFARNPPRFLQPGDEVQVEIESVGKLVNPVVAEGREA